MTLTKEARREMVDLFRESASLYMKTAPYALLRADVPSFTYSAPVSEAGKRADALRSTGDYRGALKLAKELFYSKNFGDVMYITDVICSELNKKLKPDIRERLSITLPAVAKMLFRP